MSDPRTIATYDAKAADYAQLVTSDAPDKTLQSFIDLMPKGGRVLDLGCGPGVSSVHMREAGLLPDAVDASAGMIDIATTKFGLDARIATFDDIAGEEIYAGVWANFSLLHAAREDLPRYFAALYKATCPGGTLHVGMKTGTGMDRDTIDRRYTYVSVLELTALLTAAGYTVNFTKEGAERGMAGTIDPFVIMRGEKPNNA
jgi:trans-aconitate methyltransferase